MNQKKMRNKTPLIGFTLVEILLALAILGVGLVGILSVFVVGTNSIRRTIAMTEASFLGQMIMENYKRLAKSNPNANPITFDYSQYYDDYQVEAVGPNQQDNLYKLDVKVYKKNDLEHPIVILTTYATKYEP